MKILEVIAGFGAGGAETLLKDLSIGFKRHHHEVLVIIIDQFSDDISELSKIKQLRENGIKVISLQRMPGDKSFFLFFKIGKILKEYKPTLIHVHSFLGAMYFFPFSLYLRKSKFIQTIHSTQISGGKLPKRLYSLLIDLKYKNVYCSDEAFYSLKKIIGEGIVINNGVASSAKHNIRNCIEKEYSIPKESIIILSVGRVIEAKNQLLLIDLIENLNNELYKGKIYLLLCGKHYNDKLYENLITGIDQLKFRNNIKFIGVKDNIHDLMYSSDLFISSSIYEGLPITVLEAMNTGVPLVLSPIKEHLNVFGYLEACYFPKNNTVAAYVELFRGNEEIFTGKKEENIINREFLIQKYDIESTVQNYLNFFESLFKSKNRKTEV